MNALENEKLLVRDATIVDLDALVRLKPARTIHLDRLRDAQQPGFRYLVLELNGQLIGFVCLVFVRPRYWSDGDSTDQLPTAIDFRIDSQWQGRGYGSYFLREVERLAAKAESKEFYLWVNPVDNPRAYSLYLRLGYRPLQEQPYQFHWEFVDSAGQLHAGDTWRLDLVKSI